MSFEWLWRFGARAPGPRDGAALNLDALVPDVERLGAGEPSAVAAEGGRRRRRRDSVEAELSAKLLGAHLANRHQISYPLTLDFRSLATAQADCLVDVVSATLAADGESPPARTARAEERLRRIGADDAMIDRLREGRGAATPLAELVDRARAQDIAAHAYAVALLTAETRSPVSSLFLAYLAARLGLTQQVIGSLNRRFRG
jgi:hypothetical protein